MISYHLTSGYDASRYGRGFKEADTNDLGRLMKGITKYTWSPCIWKGGERKETNFLRADWCVLDFDNGQMTLAEACKTFCDTLHMVGTTRSHQVPKDGPPTDRFRVIIKFTDSILNLDDYRYTIAQVIKRYPVDPSPKDGARFFFPCREIVQSSSEGYTEDNLKDPGIRSVRGRRRFDAYRAAGVMPPWVKHKFIDVIPVGKRNTTWFGIAKDLWRLGMDQEDITMMIVQSKTYAGGVAPDIVREIEQCVLNGIKSAESEKELDDGRTEAPED